MRETVAALREAGIGVILDLVFNHTGESDELGPTLSLRGLDNRAYYRHRDRPGQLVNDTGTGNTLACDHPVVQRLVLDYASAFRPAMPASTASASISRRSWARRRTASIRTRRCSARYRDDPVLQDRVLIAEPWDIGPDGYQLGNFPPPFLEWNDSFRDDVRRFWRGDRGMVGALATRLAGSSDVFAAGRATDAQRQFHRRA